MKPLMSDAEMRRRQKLQGKIGRTTSTLGLTGVALTGAAIATKKKPGALKAITKVPGLSGVSHGGLKNAAFHTSIAAGGIGGVGGFNQASIYSAESRKRKAMVKKEFGMEMGYYGEEGHPLTHEQIEVEIEKAWTPSASNFDSERSRHKRTSVYEGGSLAAAGAGGAYAAHQGVKAVEAGRKIKVKTTSEVHNRVNSAGRPYKIALGSQGKKTVELKHLKKVGGHGGKAAAGLAAVAGAAATHSAIKRKKASGWQSYEKRDSTSAFGIDHADEIAKFGNPMQALKPMAAAKQFGQGFKQAGAIKSAVGGTQTKLNMPTRAGMFVQQRKKALGIAGAGAAGAGAGAGMMRNRRP